VPFIVTGPNIPKNRVDHSLISAVDFFPTTAAIAGATIPANAELRGVDITSILHGW
jgi:arylsulfatase A-like enzyme